ncbi:hypothetical protein CQ018_08630 [Arthrobacter sp. MYb227]|uniref:hypothetical protein n=1 Tax=Arthrobacter sp. MYb227 TaxID=1848601 RepID=UPI000CFCB2B3|nr:hypothetical protein [Arthrobacter sp. MYb227]PQZ93710.1 hypothetical protein CQ018_08630 [Arthrobacter sp. MYb227]
MPQKTAQYSVFGTWALAVGILSLTLWSVSLADWPRAIGFAIGGCIVVGYSILQRRRARASPEIGLPSFARARKLAEQKKFTPDFAFVNPTPHIGVVRSEQDYGAYVFLQKRPSDESYWLGVSHEFKRHSNLQVSSAVALQTVIDDLDVRWVPPGKIHRQIMKDRFRSFRLYLLLLRLTKQ